MLLLGKLSLNKTSADNINNPHFNVLRWDLESLCNALVFEFAAVGAGSKASKSEESQLAVQLAVVELLLLEETIVLIVEIVVILELLLRDDFEKFKVDWVRVGKGLDCWEGSQVVEIIVSWGNKSCLQSLEGELLGLLRGDFAGLKGAEGSKGVLV